MIVICAYCGKLIEEKEPLENKMVSHGCCKECYVKELEKLRRVKKNNNLGKDKKAYEKK